jgi:FO synthase
MGREGAALCLKAGANDMGGVLMNESITRAAGAVHGQEFGAADIEQLIRAAGRRPVQRTTLYAAASGYRPAPAPRSGHGADPAPFEFQLMDRTGPV